MDESSQSDELEELEDEDDEDADEEVCLTSTMGSGESSLLLRRLDNSSLLITSPLLAGFFCCLGHLSNSLTSITCNFDDNGDDIDNNELELVISSSICFVCTSTV